MTTLPAAEYDERRQFCEAMRAMSRSEYIEIARILQRNNVTMSENRSGLFFDMAKLSRPVFDELLRFRDFVTKNTNELAKRDDILDSLKQPGCDKY